MWKDLYHKIEAQQKKAAEKCVGSASIDCGKTEHEQE